MNDEYLKELSMTYHDLCKYLQKKYGLASCDYFTTTECKSKSKKVTRTAEGLFCHHIYEDRYDNLGDPVMARMQPYEAQKKENLVYCNYIEHLIFHLKINANARFAFTEAYEIKYFFNSLGFVWIAKDINYLFKNGGSLEKWRNNCFNVIKENYEDYVSILRSSLCFIDKGFAGDKKRRISEGEELVFEVPDVDAKADLNELRGHQYKRKKLCFTVAKIDESKDVIYLIIADHEFEITELLDLKFMTPGFLGGVRRDKSMIAYRFSEISKLYDYESILDEKKDEMSLLGEEGVWNELRKRLDAPFNEEDMEYALCIEKSLG